MTDEQQQDGMRELESVSHEHAYGPWQERGVEVVLFTRYYLQARQCLDPRCGWVQHARTLAVTRNSGAVSADD